MYSRLLYCLAVTVLSLLVVGIPFPPLLQAATYQWEDEEGNVNFSDDLTRVPPAFREKTVERSGPVSETGASGERRAVSGMEDDSGVSGSTVAPAATSGEEADPYEECMEGVDQRKDKLEKQLAADKARLEDLTLGIRRTTLARAKRQYKKERIQVEEKIRQTEKALRTEVPGQVKECRSLAQP